MRLFDTHAHIDEKRFRSDQDEMLKLCFEAGVEYILCPAIDRATSEASIALGKKYKQVYSAVGVHPHEAKDATDDDFDAFIKWAKEEPKVVALGEMGLDYYYNHSDRETQKRVFKRQLDLAREVDLPIIIHDRDAHGDIMDILRRDGKGVRGVFHCFSGSYEMAMEAIKMDYYISFAGPVVFPNAVNLKDIAARIPLERLLIETDSPYLTPPPFRGRRNDPSKVFFVAEEIARLRNLSTEELAEVTLENGKRCFGIVS